MEVQSLLRTLEDRRHMGSLADEILKVHIKVLVAIFVLAEEALYSLDRAVREDLIVRASLVYSLVNDGNLDSEYLLDRTQKGRLI